MGSPDPKPPPRTAHIFAHEQGEPLEQAQRALLHTLAILCDGVEFSGDATGRIACEQLDDAGIRIAFHVEQGAGYIELTPVDNGWIRAELFLDNVFQLRAWIESAYEETELWPDNSDGIGDAPGRLSKRAAWLTIDSARFPGVPANAQGYWQVEEIES